MPEDERIQALEANVEFLRRELEETRSELRAAKERTALTMRGQLICPSCGCRRIVHSPSVLDRSDSGRGTLALIQPSVWRDAGMGEFETYVCSACGFTEWYVKDAEDLEKHGEPFRVLDGYEPGGDGPYR
jgi:predicted nucleic-acid-binding Zn-ribbon protein